MTAVLELRQVSKRFTLPTGEHLDILIEIDLTVAPGEVVAIVGRSGSGKSTLLSILGLLEQPSSGTYFVNGADAAGLGDAKAAKLRGAFFGFIFQQFFLLDRRTALENVAEPLLYATTRELTRRDERAFELLDRVGLANRARSMPHLLSGGEQQRVAIARALARAPRVVLADEPTGSLDATNGERVLDLLLHLVRAEGVSLLLVTHDLALARRADRVLSPVNGQLREEAS